VRVLLTTLGSHGDVHPFFALARALKARGHQAPVLTNPHFARQARRAGVTLIPLSDAVDIRDLMQTPGAMDPLRGPKVVLRDLLLPQVGRIFARTAEVIDRIKPDALVAHPICLGAPWAAERAGVRVVSVALAPVSYMNPRDTIVFGPWRGHAPTRRAVGFDLFVGRWAMRWMLDGPLNRVRRSLGLPRERDLLIGEFVRPGLNLGLWSPAFRPPLPDDPRGATICGFPWFDTHHDHQTDDEALDAFLDAGEPPIVFTLGTAAVHTPGAFFEHAARACVNLGKRGLLLVGRGHALPTGLPPTIGAFAYAPFSALLPRAAMTVHHGGIGSTAQGLRSGRPTLICPLSHDQFDNAARAKRMGVSETLPHRHLSVQSLTSALDRVARDRAMHDRAHALGRVVTSEDGAAVAALALEAALIGSRATIRGLP
jgi:UDP:flavonoid glycosyltransferase YjiC (YdhE family)